MIAVTEPQSTASRLHLLRVTLEAVTPLSIGSGQFISAKRRLPPRDATAADVGLDSDREETIHAAAIMRAANGLPVLPGPSWQGVLRRLYAEAHGDSKADALFGREGEAEGQAGRLRCGWGHAHDKNDRVVPELFLSAARSENDDVLSLLLAPAPVWRDHVAFNDRHAPDGARKYARAAVPVGTRFSLEISAWGGSETAADLKSVAALFGHPRFRLGSATNRGYGRVAVVRASYQAPALTDGTALRNLRGQLPSTPLATPLDLQGPSDAMATRAVVTLTFSDFFRIGGATEACAALTVGTKGARSFPDGRREYGPRSADPREARDNVLLLLTEPRIVYRNGLGTVETGTSGTFRFPLPGASVKGALAHRMIYHANKAAGRMIDADTLCAQDAAAQDAALAALRGPLPGLEALLGSGKGPRREDGSPGTGAATRWSVSDTDIATADWIMAVDHAPIDRFTGGVRNGFLFAEEVLVRARVEIEITLLPPRQPTGGGIGGWPKATEQAFLKALRDLCHGRLALGGRSNGFAAGEIVWSGPDAADWNAAATQLRIASRDAP